MATGSSLLVIVNVAADAEFSLLVNLESRVPFYRIKLLNIVIAAVEGQVILKCPFGVFFFFHWLGKILIY